MSVAQITTTHRAIASLSRAHTIVEAVAVKHGIDVHTLHAGGRSRFVVEARGEAAFELMHKLGWSQRRIGECLGCSQPNVRKLLGYHKQNLERGGRFLPAADIHALLAISNDDRLARAVEAEERAAYAEGELHRLNGSALSLRFADALDISYMRCAIVLAIVAEAYPRVVLGDAMVEHYDEACAALGYGFKRGANFHLLTKNVAHLREHFAAKGWPSPIPASTDTTREMAGSRRLSDECAAFLHERLNAPKLSQMQEASEQRSLRVRSATVRQIA